MQRLCTFIFLVGLVVFGVGRSASADESPRPHHIEQQSRILRFIENHSNWQNSLPPEYRLENFECNDVTSATVAMAKLNEVVPRQHPPIPLPEPPAAYLGRLQKRLEAIAAGKIGGVSPIHRMPR